MAISQVAQKAQAELDLSRTQELMKSAPPTTTNHPKYLPANSAKSDPTAERGLGAKKIDGLTDVLVNPDEVLAAPKAHGGPVAFDNYDVRSKSWTSLTLQSKMPKKR